MTQIWVECITTLWLIASGPVLGYHVEIDGQLVAETSEAVYELCIEEKYQLTTMRVQGFNETTVGEWSDPLEISRVHNFDANDSGVSDFSDFGQFVRDFGMCYKESGVAGECPINP